MNSKSHLVIQPMEQGVHHTDEDKIECNMPIETVAVYATAASANNTTEGKGPNLNTSSAFTDRKQIAAAMPSTATIATEASSTAPSIETTFIAAVSATTQDPTGSLDKHLGNSLATLSLSDLDFEVQSFQAQDDNEERFLSSLKEGLEFMTRPRKSEKHIYALAEFLLDDSDDENDENQDYMQEY